MGEIGARIPQLGTAEDRFEVLIMRGFECRASGQLKQDQTKES